VISLLGDRYRLGEMTPLLLALRPIPRAGVDHGDEDN
jgi:hypothetical protein